MQDTTPFYIFNLIFVFSIINYRRWDPMGPEVANFSIVMILWEEWRAVVIKTWWWRMSITLMNNSEAMSWRTRTELVVVDNNNNSKNISSRPRM